MRRRGRFAVEWDDTRRIAGVLTATDRRRIIAVECDGIRRIAGVHTATDRRRTSAGYSMAASAHRSQSYVAIQFSTLRNKDDSRTQNESFKGLCFVVKKISLTAVFFERVRVL